MMDHVYGTGTVLFVDKPRYSLIAKEIIETFLTQMILPGRNPLPSFGRSTRHGNTVAGMSIGGNRPNVGYQRL